MPYCLLICVRLFWLHWNFVSVLSEVASLPIRYPLPIPVPFLFCSLSVSVPVPVWVPWHFYYSSFEDDRNLLIWRISLRVLFYLYLFAYLLSLKWQNTPTVFLVYPTTPIYIRNFLMITLSTQKVTLVSKPQIKMFAPIYISNRIIINT